MPSFRLLTALVAITILASSVQAAPVPNGFDAIDISRTPGDGAAALAAAQAICPASASPDDLKRKGDTAETAELQFFNVEIADANNDAAKKAIDCQKQRNKVLKNTCQKQKADIEGNQAESDKNAKQVQNNIDDVNRLCPGVDESLFIGNGQGSTGSSTRTAGQASDGPRTSAATQEGADGKPTFRSIDISNDAPGNGESAQAAAERRCPTSAGGEAALAVTDVAEKAELELFNPAIDAASGAKKEALQCQKDRNKVLKNFCQRRGFELTNRPADADKKTPIINKNKQDVTRGCVDVDTSLFIAAEN